MSRLILVPQFPARLRYQEWWYSELPKNYAPRFNDLIVLGGDSVDACQGEAGEFSPMTAAVSFELHQIREYLDVSLRDDDILLLCDLSFPGIFSHALLHKRPKRCFAICHATSRNRYDYFSKDRSAKWAIESGLSRLFEVVFVSTDYHRNKLSAWPNVEVVGLPLPDIPPWMSAPDGKRREVVCVARSNIQKRNRTLERWAERQLGITIQVPNARSWRDYYTFLSGARVLLVTAREETFGYQIVDAIANDCVPIAPRGYAFPELLPEQYLYRDRHEMISKIQAALDGGLPTPTLCIRQRCLLFYERTADRMMRGGEDK